jgi:phthiodiolone/phenolphthiodiolone dimycocerosates ketoreductase
MRRLAERAVDGGVDSLWWSDHLMSFASPDLWTTQEGRPDESSLHAYADPFVCMTACSTVTRDVDIGVCVMDGVRRMPATLVQSAISVAHAVEGRVLLGLGSGERMNYEPYGWTVESPAAQFKQAALDIRHFLDHSGPDERGAIVGLRPPKPANGPELWIAAHGPKGFDLAGQCGDGWIPVALDHVGWREGRAAVVAAARSHGRDPDAITFAAAIDVLVQESHEQAHQLLGHPAVRLGCLLVAPEVFTRYGVEHPLGSSAFESLVATLAGPELLAATAAIPDQLVHDQIPHGTPSEVAESISRFDGLEHVRLSDLSGLVPGGTGGLNRLLEIADRLRAG